MQYSNSNDNGGGLIVEEGASSNVNVRDPGLFVTNNNDDNDEVCKSEVVGVEEEGASSNVHLFVNRSNDDGEELCKSEVVGVEEEGSSSNVHLFVNRSNDDGEELCKSEVVGVEEEGASSNVHLFVNNSNDEEEFCKFEVRIVEEDGASSNVHMGDGHVFVNNNNDEEEFCKFEVRIVEKEESLNVDEGDGRVFVNNNNDEEEFCKFEVRIVDKGVSPNVDEGDGRVFVKNEDEEKLCKFEEGVQEEGASSNVNVGDGHLWKSEVRGVLPPMAGGNPNKRTLVLDLDRTLVYSSATPIPAGYDFTVTFEGDGEPSFYVLKRPGVDKLLQELGATGLYEIVLFTAAGGQYADAVVDKLLESLPPSENNDTNIHIIPPTHRLFQYHCCKVEGIPENKDVKDLSILGRDLRNVIFVDDNPFSYFLQPRNAIPIDPWTGEDPQDISLYKIMFFCLTVADPTLSYATEDVRDLIPIRFENTILD